jgi:hypothetical protein
MPDWRTIGRLLFVVAAAILTGCGGGTNSPVDPQSCAASQAITGTIVDGTLPNSNQPVSGAVVVLELATTQLFNPIATYRPAAQTTTRADGSFTVCSTAASEFLVAAGAGSGGNPYPPTVIPHIKPGSSVGKLPLGSSGRGVSVPGSIAGVITSVPVGVDVSVSALGSIDSGSESYLFTVPLPATTSSALALTTAQGGSCPSGTSCVGYKLVLPSQSALYATTITVNGQPVASWGQAASDPYYMIDAAAFTRGTQSATCVPSRVATILQTDGNTLQVHSGSTLTANTLALTACQ